jgi:hypothetical protein
MSYDPTQQPSPEQGPYYEYSNPTPNSNPQIPSEASYAPSGMPGQGPTTTPLPLGHALEHLPVQYWKILSKPGARVFAEESGKAKWNILLVQLIAFTLLDALLGFLHNSLYPITVQSVSVANSNGVDVAKIQSAEIAILTFTSGLGLFFLVPLGFFIYQGIAFGIARAFGGQGSFLAQSYVTLLVYVSLGLINLALLYVPIPILPGVLGLALNIYGIVLVVFAMMGAHRLGGGKASAAALLPFLGLLLLACCGLFIALIPAISSAVPPQ